MGDGGGLRPVFSRMFPTVNEACRWIEKINYEWMKVERQGDHFLLTAEVKENKNERSETELSRV